MQPNVPGLADWLYCRFWQPNSAILGDHGGAARRAHPAGFEAFNRCDLEAPRRLRTPTASYALASLASRDLRTAVTTEWRSFADVRESRDGVKQTPERFIEVDDERVLIPTRFEGRGKASGIQIEQQIASVWTIRNERVVRIESHESLEDALKNVGLRG